MCLYACPTTLRHAPYEMMDGVLGYLPLDPDQNITELMDSLRCNLVASDGPKHDVLEMTLSRLSHQLRTNLLSFVKRTGRQCQTCQFQCSLANSSQAPWCWAMSTGPTRGHLAFKEMQKF
ncbi:hypothetical protein ATANTOWER_024156 [Ataeniobius toweri]|uniref:Uncharacterized protein n=1 Tax=Ataeniobius toweri TaxID=208326 RepID=A0ABU7BHE2_9TELE|nr:hypothetical protein [Ataeniobius toweri]